MRASATSLFLLFTLFMNAIGLFEGESCIFVHKNRTFQSGQCIDVSNCDFARRLLEKGEIPENCGFTRNSPLVCCPMNTIPSTTTAEKKCAEYQKYRLINGPSVAHGVRAHPREFRHMAGIGYGNANNILCGGSLISERFVLTAAHCARSRDFGDAKWVRLGDLDIKNTTEDAQPEDHTVISIIIHPKYNSSSYYHDVALLKLEKSVNFTSYIRPACLQVKKILPSTRLLVTGWGSTEFLGERSSHLMKATVKVISHSKCAEIYASASGRKLKKGIIDDLQICAGDESGQDTCPGDSGGPLQYVFPQTVKLLRHYVVVGITSFGKACGLENSCGVYTRVSAYVPWIESVVWSSDT